MKTLILNGSPRQNGDTAALLRVLREQLDGDVVQVNAYDGTVRPCCDCRWCSTHAYCVIQDEMQDIYRRIDEANLIVLASPLHFSELTGPLLSLLSRLQYLWMARYVRKKPALSERMRRGMVILTGGGDGFSERAEATAAVLLHQMGAEVTGVVRSLHTDRVRAGEDQEALAEVRRLAAACRADEKAVAGR